MVKPITKSQTTSTTVYFPGGPDEIWVDIYTGEIYHGTGLIQVKAPLNKVNFCNFITSKRTKYAHII